MNFMQLQLLAEEAIDPSDTTCTLLSDSADAAMVLFLASAQRAECFAMAMHERAAWSLDQALIQHWAEVVTEIRRLTVAQQDPRRAPQAALPTAPLSVSRESAS